MKIIPIKSTQQEITTRKIELFGNMFFGGFPEAEMKLMKGLVSIGQSGPINITPNITKGLSEEAGLSENTLNVALHRLHKKGALRKNKRVITLHPIFHGLADEKQYLIKFEIKE